MRQFAHWCQNVRVRYFLLGAAFGCLFPIFATILDILFRHTQLTLDNILWVQSTQPLHWMIDTAPLFLGLFASFVDRKQDRINMLNAQLEQRTDDRTVELQRLNRNLEHEIANHKRAEKALQESEKRFSDIALSSADWIWEVNKSGIYTFTSGRVKEILGYEPHELMGRTPFEFMPTEEAARVGQIFQGIASEKKPIVDLENWNLTKDGERVCLLTNGVPILSEKNELLGYRGVDKDITEHKRAHALKQELQAELERARRMKSIGVLAGGVAHDLNNMLGPLVAYPDLIAEELPQSSPIRDQILCMGQAARRAADVIQDLLTLARRGRYEMSPVDLNEIIEAYLESPTHKVLAKEHPDIVVHLDLDHTIRNIDGSSHHLSKVVMNLIRNAFDAMPMGGELTLQTSQSQIETLLGGYDEVTPGNYVLLKVVDTGVGIDQDDLDKVFEPYFSKKKMGTSGSGLGLSVVYGVTKDHGGYYDIFSKVGEGTEFVLYFPAVEELIEQEPHSKHDFHGHDTILVVDDDRIQREVASVLLSDLGYEVEVAANGREAVKYLKKNSVAVVVLDMIMENGFDGLDTYREIVKYHPGQKVVIVSGFSATDRVAEMQRLGAGPYIRKPYTRDELGAAIRQVLDTIPATREWAADVPSAVI